MSMTFKTDLLPHQNLTYTLGSTTAQWNIYGKLNGNASTATALQTARTFTIGNTSKSFNGSANVSWSAAEIGYVPKIIVTDAVDLNTMTTTAFYYIKNSNCPNIPTGNHGLLIVDYDCGTPFQLWLADNRMDMYKRYWNITDSVWTSWALMEAAPKAHTHAYLPYSEVDSLDANTCSPGLYCARVVPSNVPTSNHGLLLYINNLGTPFQMWYPDNARVIYKRWYTSGAWTGWGVMNAAWA